MPRHDAALDHGIARVRTPAAIAETFVEPDRGALRVAQIEVQNDKPQLARQRLDFANDRVADAAPARPGGHESAGDGAGEGLCLVVARRPRELHRPGDDAVESPDDELPLATAGELSLRWLHRDAGEDLVAAVRAADWPAGDVHAFVHGEATSVREVRKFMVVERGVSPDALSVSGYWKRQRTEDGWREDKAEWNRLVEADATAV